MAWSFYACVFVVTVIRLCCSVNGEVEMNSKNEIERSHPCASAILNNGSYTVNCQIDDPVLSVYRAVVYLSKIMNPVNRLNVNGTFVDKFVHLAPYHMFGNVTVTEISIIGNVSMDNLTWLNYTFIAQRNSLAALRIGGDTWRVHGSLKEIPSKAIKILGHLKSLDLQQNTINMVDIGDLDGLTSLQHLDLSQNRISVLRQGSLTPVKTTLVTLNLADNRLYTLANEIFMGLTILESLDVRNNNLLAVTSDTIAPLKNLKELRLSSNYIGRIANDTLAIPSLQFVQLSYNKLESIEADTFDHKMANLSTVQLDNNRISSLAKYSFHNLPSLTSIFLGNNMITRIENQTFSGLPKLMELYLGTNMITNIEAQAFKSLPNLKKLELWDNHLTILDQLTFQYVWSHLDVLDVGRNHFKCDCSILWIYESLHGSEMKHPKMLLMYCKNIQQQKFYDVVRINRINIEC